MFDVGFSELVLISVIGLVVLGPEKLATVVRTASRWMSKIKSSIDSVKVEAIKIAELQEIQKQVNVAENKVGQTLSSQTTSLAKTNSEIATSISDIKRSVQS